MPSLPLLGLADLTEDVEANGSSRQVQALVGQPKIKSVEVDSLAVSMAGTRAI